MPSYSHTLEVNSGSAHIFAILTDVARTPEFHERCTALESIDAGPFVVGQRLRYSYRDGRRSGTMDGHVAVFEPQRRVAFQFTDSMTDVTIDFRAEELRTDRTSLTHTVTIHTKGLAKVLTPVITHQLKRQAPADLANLKRLAERG
jgi:hypothetical protein